MEILKSKQEIQYQIQLSETEVSERLNNLLDTKQQSAPNVFGGTCQQNRFEIYNVNAGLWLIPIVRGTFANGELSMNLEPSKQFKLAVFMMAFVAIGLFISLILDFNSGWYFLPLLVGFFLTLVNFEGLRNYRNIQETLERTLQLTDKKRI
jgi:hypothetical protein